MPKENQEYLKRVRKLKGALLEFMNAESRKYSELESIEQSVQDLTNALNLRLDQISICLTGCTAYPAQVDPRQKLADRLLKTAARLTEGGNVDHDIADEFESTLDMFDLSADLERKAQSARDKAESAAIKHKRKKGNK